MSAAVAVLPPRTAPRAVVVADGVRPGLSTVVSSGAYRGTVAWPSRDIFLRGLRAGLKAHPELRRLTAKDVVGLDRCMRVLEVETRQAEYGTGRDMRALEAETARAVGCSVEDVQRVHRIASRVMHVMVPIAAGRLLTIFERLDVWGRQIRPRLKQRGVPSVWAFHVPAWLRPFVAAAAIHVLPVDNPGHRRAFSDPSAPHPRSGDVRVPPNPLDTSPSPATSSKDGSLRSRSGPGSARTALNNEKRPAPGRPLAAELVKAMPLLRSTSPKRLENALKRFAESRPMWHGQDLLDAFSTICERSGRSVSPPVDRIHTPWAYVVSLLRELHEHDDHPRLAVVDPAELRCGRDECDHGWISDVGRDQVRRCDQCRPGAWPEPSYEELADEVYDELDDDPEVPF